MRMLHEIAAGAKAAAGTVARLGTEQKNRALEAIADCLETNVQTILAANQRDMENGRQSGLGSGLLDRLLLDQGRIASIAQGCRQVAALPDPIGEVLWMKRLPNGLNIGQRRVPMGVIGMIYEARPNVTVDAAVLCLKAGSACILRGGKEAFYTSMALTGLMREALSAQGIDPNAINLVEDTERETARQMMCLNGMIDVLIPRGGAGLIQTVVQQATVPVIETGTGNCHVYVDESADLEMALSILRNAKCQRPSVCNACESLLVHRAVAEEFLPRAYAMLQSEGVTIHGCPRTCAILGEGVLPATEQDYGQEYLALELSCKVVDTLDKAICHINRFGTGHSESIVTRDYAASQRFLDEVDAAAVYVNASTRFTDGFEYGFGAEIGISTQKLHARGPMGLLALTTTKYICYGNGQVR